MPTTQRCALCLSDIPYGAHLCRECGAEIHYGAEDNDYSTDRLLSGLAGISAFLAWEGVIFVGTVAVIGGNKSNLPIVIAIFIAGWFVAGIAYKVVLKKRMTVTQQRHRNKVVYMKARPTVTHYHNH